MPTVKCPFCAEEIQAEALKCKHCHSWIGARARTHNDGPWAPAGWAEDAANRLNQGVSSFASRPLLRSSDRKMLTGICAGLADYFRVDPTLVRLLYVLVTFLSGIVPGLVAYTIMTVVVPSDDGR